MEFLVEHFVEIFFGLLSAGALGFCKYLMGQIKEYKKLLELRESENIDKAIDKKLLPVKTELEKKIELVLDKVEELKFLTQDQMNCMEDEIKELSDEEHFHMDQIIRSWRFRIIQLCELYLEQGFMTKAQFTQLSEMYTLYHTLGGNGQVTDYYEKAKKLDIMHDEK